MNLVLTPGHRGDSPQSRGLLNGLEPSRVIADGAYDANQLHEYVAASGGVTCIKQNSTRKRKWPFDEEAYKRRNVIERFFRRLKECRRVATRYEKKAINFAGFVWLAAGVTA